MFFTFCNINNICDLKGAFHLTSSKDIYFDPKVSHILKHKEFSLSPCGKSTSGLLGLVDFDYIGSNAYPLYNIFGYACNIGEQVNTTFLYSPREGMILSNNIMSKNKCLITKFEGKIFTYKMNNSTGFSELISVKDGITMSYDEFCSASYHKSDDYYKKDYDKMMSSAREDNLKFAFKRDIVNDSVSFSVELESSYSHCVKFVSDLTHLEKYYFTQDYEINKSSFDYPFELKPSGSFRYSDGDIYSRSDSINTKYNKIFSSDLINGYLSPQSVKDVDFFYVYFKHKIKKYSAIKEKPKDYGNFNKYGDCSNNPSYNYILKGELIKEYISSNLEDDLKEFLNKFYHINHFINGCKSAFVEGSFKDELILGEGLNSSHSFESSLPLSALISDLDDDKKIDFFNALLFDDDLIFSSLLKSKFFFSDLDKALDQFDYIYNHLLNKSFSYLNDENFVFEVDCDFDILCFRNSLNRDKNLFHKFEFSSLKSANPTFKTIEELKELKDLKEFEKCLFLK